ncbi:hypothetical protein DYB38_007051 [Aphanomyces astaci]|uniref:SWIM-type domain-containing protein n=2 Tax=Aphanomyces astaci TaxID=112090 RepID=A0A397DL73_APHAT|nr:hypothetical protein DYB38_007051 [Aphanomyces astaci]
MNNVRLACALVPSESEGHCSWFFRFCIDCGVVLTTVPDMSDLGFGIIAAARAVGIELKFCTLHIIRNLTSKFGKLFRQEHHNLIWESQGALQEIQYTAGLADLAVACGEQVQAYVANIDPVKWVIYPNIKTAMLYGWSTTNCVESEHNTSLMNNIRYSLPFPFVSAFVDFMRHDFKKKSDRAKKWIAEDRKVTPGALKAYDQQLQLAGQYATEPVSDDIFHVYSTTRLPKFKRRVVVSNRECSCAFMDQNGIPCRHFIASMLAAGTAARIFDSFDDVYLVSVYASVFDGAFVLPPIEEELYEYKFASSKRTTKLPRPRIVIRVPNHTMDPTQLPASHKVPCIGVRSTFNYRNLTNDERHAAYDMVLAEARFYVIDSSALWRFYRDNQPYMEARSDFTCRCLQ